MNELEGSPKTWPPLGLPTGSVRALLTLLVLAVVLTSLVQNRDIGILWNEALLIALAHYFTSRRFVALSPAVIKRLEAEGVIEQERHPLYLPKHSIRLVIFASFVGIAVYLYREQRLFEAQTVSLLGIVYAYLLGSIFQAIGSWFHRKADSQPSRLWTDGKAAVALLVLIIASIPEFLGITKGVPRELHQIAIGIMLFYFGSR